MKAFVMRGIGRVGFAEKPIPTPGPDDVIVKTTRALICTSDSHTVRGAIGPRENLTLGHEAVGVVYAVGSNVKLFKPGDRVLVGAITPDWGDPSLDVRRSQLEPLASSGAMASPLRPMPAGLAPDSIVRHVSPKSPLTEKGLPLLV